MQRKSDGTSKGPGTNIGKSAVAQIISALENLRKMTAHEHRDSMEAQFSLRSDSRISTFESVVKHNEPKCIESSQLLKAAGSSAGEFLSDSVS